MSCYVMLCYLGTLDTAFFTTGLTIMFVIARFTRSERSDLSLCPWDWSSRYCTNRRERPSLLDLLSEFGLISDGCLVSISLLEIEPMHLSVEGLRPWDWSYPVLQYLREWPTPRVFVTGTVVKPTTIYNCVIIIIISDNGSYRIMEYVIRRY